MCRASDKQSLESLIERAFNHRKPPDRVRDESDRKEADADFFSGRQWKWISIDDWNTHSDAIFEFNTEAFCYFLPSIMILSMSNMHPNVTLNSLIGFFDADYDCDMWTDYMKNRTRALSYEELSALNQWVYYLKLNGYSFSWNNEYDRVKNVITKTLDFVKGLHIS